LARRDFLNRPQSRTSAPRVSVLLPVRDAAARLPECLESLAAQSLREHEVVAIDDGSVDASREILESAAVRDPRLRVMNSPGRGLVVALNAAAREARAPLLARMDSDDVSAPERLLLQATRLDNEPETAILGCRVKLRGGMAEGLRRYVNWQNELLDHDAIARDAFVESPLVHPSVMLRSSTLSALGGYVDDAGPEDYDLWLRALSAGYRFGKLSEVLLEWRDHPGRLTRTDPRYAPERFFERKLAALQDGALARRPDVVIWGAGPIGKTWARALQARGHRVVAFVDVAPRRIGQTIHGAPCLTAEEAGTYRDALHLAAVGQAGGRARVRAEAARVGVADVIAIA
jgi:glycosyltransferase involved in cell wall biosynthesis